MELVGPTMEHRLLVAALSVAIAAVVAYLVRLAVRSLYREEEPQEDSLKAQLEVAEARVLELRSKMARGGRLLVPRPPVTDKPLRIWMDGAFDMMHYGCAARPALASRHLLSPLPLPPCVQAHERLPAGPCSQPEYPPGRGRQRR